ncbi:MAG: DMT family transporter [Sphaerochaetaceae bacterium]
MKSITADLSLLSIGFIWGTGFIATHWALESGMPATMTMLFRFSVSAIILGAFIFRRLKNISKKDLRMGSVAGFLLFAAFLTQTFGLEYSTPSNSAFLTGVNVVLVPFITWIIFRRRPKIKFFILPLITFVGIVILTYEGQGAFSLSKGDALTLLCAFLFALHISYLDVASKKMDTIILTFMQMSAAAVLSLFSFLLLDVNSLPAINFAVGLPAVLYSGIFCTLITFGLQTVAQQYTTSGKAAIFLSTESLFGALFSVILGIEPFTYNMLIGGSIILFAIVASEVRLSDLLRKEKTIICEE